MNVKGAIALGLAAGVLGFLPASAPVMAKGVPGVRLCGLYSSILLMPGEHAQISGAGADSVSMLVTGPGGSWLFYDGLATEKDLAVDSAEVLRNDKRVGYRRKFDARIYVVRPVPQLRVAGKAVEAAVMGVDMMRQPLDHPAITGHAADLKVVERVRPGEMSSCDLRWKPGAGLVKATH